MEQILNVDIVVGWMIKICLVLLVLGGFMLVRQADLMARVVSVPVNGGFKLLAVGYLLTALLLTAIVIVI